MHGRLRWRRSESSGGGGERERRECFFVMPFETPQKIGDYRLLHEIGRGGMGIVYEAEQISLGRRVALKLLPLASSLSSKQLQRFHNEARAAATLQHPHIVPVHEFGVENGTHFYCMQLIEGQSLAELLADCRR